MSKRYLALLLFLPLMVTAKENSVSIRIKSIEARLFLSHSGKLSAPITAKSTLWNTPIGESDAGEPSTATFVDVTLEMVPEHFEPNVILDLLIEAESKKQPHFKQQHTVGAFNAQGQYHAGFWISDTGCEPLKLTVQLRGRKTLKTIQLPFACGE
jgi:hypothetical protein